MCIQKQKKKLPTGANKSASLVQDTRNDIPYSYYNNLGPFSYYRGTMTNGYITKYKSYLSYAYFQDTNKYEYMLPRPNRYLITINCNGYIIRYMDPVIAYGYNSDGQLKRRFIEAYYCVKYHYRMATFSSYTYSYSNIFDRYYYWYTKHTGYIMYEMYNSYFYFNDTTRNNYSYFTKVAIKTRENYTYWDGKYYLTSYGQPTTTTIMFDKDYPHVSTVLYQKIISIYNYYRYTQKAYKYYYGYYYYYSGPFSDTKYSYTRAYLQD